LENNKKNSISSKQAAALLVATQLGIGFQVAPSLLAEKAGHDGWLSLIICGFLVLIAILTSTALCKRFGNQSILSITGVVCGKFFSFIINLLMLMSLIYITIAFYSLFVAGVGIWFFRTTPAWALAAYLVIPSALLASIGLKSICRFNFLLYIIIPLILFLVILNLKDFRITALLPIGEHGLSGILKAVPASLFAFTGFETILFVFPHIKDTQKITRKFSAAILITTLLFTVITAAHTGVFGDELVAKRFNAILGLARLIKLPVFERVDIYFLAVWITAMTLTMNTYLFLVHTAILQIFKPKRRFVPSLIAVFLVVVPVSIVEDNSTILKLLGFSGFVAFFVGLFVPIVLLIIAVLKNKKGGTTA
jgi:spore germination protein (amino acid permease)